MPGRRNRTLNRISIEILPGPPRPISTGQLKTMKRAPASPPSGPGAPRHRWLFGLSALIVAAASALGAATAKADSVPAVPAPTRPEPAAEPAAEAPAALSKRRLSATAAFEDAPGVLGTSIHTLRKEAVSAYATESLGVVALGLEDIRLAPVNRDGNIELNLDEQIQFEFNSHEIPKKSRRLLDAIGRLLAENPDTRVQIFSHTDDQGDAGYNLRLSERRAAAIKDYLKGRGVAEARITATGKGEEAPLIDTGGRTPTRAERARNRRTELLIEPLEAPAEEPDPGREGDPDARPGETLTQSGVPAATD